MPRRSGLTRRDAAALAAALPLLLAAAPEPGAVPDSLYSAMVIVTGTDMRSRPGGFRDCLITVVTKLTGDPAVAADPRLAELARDAAPLVVDYGYVDPLAYRRPKDDQGTYDRSYQLTVRFDRAKVDALVTALGKTIWRGERPTVVPVLRMVSDLPPWRGDVFVTADDPALAPRREAFVEAADRYGVRVALPSQADAAALARATPDDAPRRMVVVGEIAFREADFGWSGGWRTSWRGRTSRAEIKGVGFDRAFDRLVRGAVQLAAGTGPFQA